MRRATVLALDFARNGGARTMVFGDPGRASFDRWGFTYDTAVFVLNASQKIQNRESGSIYIGSHHVNNNIADNILDMMRAGSQSDFRDLLIFTRREREELEDDLNLLEKRISDDFPSASIWLDWYRQRLHGEERFLPWEYQWASLSDEQFAQSVESINGQLRDLQDKSHLDRSEHNKFRRARAIFLGNAGVGKTSIINVLNGEPPAAHDEVTKGVAQRIQSLLSNEPQQIHDEADAVARVYDAESGVTVHYWDFGGQVIAHGTHQFFLRSSCLYVIVLDGRLGDRSTNEAEYWLEFVKAFASIDTPVIIIGNKSEILPVQIDLHSIKMRHPNVIDFFNISAARAFDEKDDIWRARFALFEEVFKEQIAKLASGPNLTASQASAISEIQEKSGQAAWLSREAFLSVCDSNGIAKSEAPRFLDLLDKLGIVIHFPQLARLSDYILNPRWLTYGVYSILYSEKARQQSGSISEKDVVDILSGTTIVDPTGVNFSFSAERVGHIVDAMSAFQIAYTLPDRSLVVPSLLSLERPSFDFPISGSIAFRVCFPGFIPPHAFPNLVLRHHLDIAKHGKAIWRNGVMLRPRPHYDAEALLELNERSSILNIFVRGVHANSLLGLLVNSVRSILSTMPDLNFHEQIRLEPEMAVIERSEQYPRGHVWTNWRSVETADRKKQPTIVEGDFMYSIDRILKHAPKTYVPGNADVFISYGAEDEEIAGTLYRSLKAEDINVWWDKKVKIGEIWRLRILEEVRSARVVVVIWSGYSVESKYVLAEADLAFSLGKLVQVCPRDFDRSTVPIPFNVEQVSSLDDFDGFLARVSSLIRSGEMKF